MPINPYQAPTATTQGTTTTVSLYRLAAVGLATFLGSPLAGGWIITQNLKRLQRDVEVKKTWLIAVGFMLVLICAVLLLPTDSPAAQLTGTAAAAMYFYAKHCFGDALNEHAAGGGCFLSNWRAIGVGILVATALFAISTAVFFVLFFLGYLSIVGH